MIISLNGYVEKISIFNKTNMSLENFEYIEELINNFCDDKEGQVLLPDLRPHNRYTYKEIKKGETIQQTPPEVLDEQHKRDTLQEYLNGAKKVKPIRKRT